MDVLSDVLDTIRLQSALFVQAEMAPPWGIRAEASEHWAFHIVTRGHCWLGVDELPAIQVGTGDVVLVARGRGHVLLDAPSSKARSFREIAAEGGFAPRPAGAPPVNGSTGLVCGTFKFQDAGSAQLVASLPPVIHASEMAGEVGPWLAQTVRLLAYESRGDRPGNATVLNRLCDSLFVYIVRSHLAQLPEGAPSWLRALVDPQVGGVLKLIHEQPGEPWTVATLASRAGMSRSGFAARFAELVGETPMQYLIRWRLEKAAGLLRDGGAGIAEVAARVGYESEAAFHKAFKRSLGVAPGAYRRAARLPAS